MRNTWIVCPKELGSYFVSPVAYLLLTMFGLILGFFFWNALAYFVVEGIEMQMRGQMFPRNLNEQIIRPLLANVGVIGLFFIPMITMRLFAEEKRSGTIELLATSPIRDLEIIVGKWQRSGRGATRPLLQTSTFPAPRIRSLLAVTSSIRFLVLAVPPR